MLPGIFNAYNRKILMTRLTNEAPGNVTPILPIEAAVTGGRSAWAWKRSGFLEFQERFLEEIAVAAVWLFGVSTMSKIMDKGINRLIEKGKIQQIYTEADWSKRFMAMFLPGKKAPTIAMSSLERFSGNFKTMIRTLGIKGVKWGVSIAVPLVLTAYVIPKLNQLKTEWILKNFYKKKAEAPEKAPSQADTKNQQPGRTVQTDFVQSQPAIWSQSAPASAYNGYAYNHRLAIPPFYRPAFGTAQTMPVKSELANKKGALSHGVRFGFSPTQAFSMLSKFGDVIDNSLYGRILVVDASLTGGRMAVAWPRSKYESFEYFARDGLSTIFYLLSVPWIMNSASHMLNAPWANNLSRRITGKELATSINLDEQVSGRLNTHIVRKLEALGHGIVTPERFKTLMEGVPLQGVSEEALANIKTALGSRLRQASLPDFTRMLGREMSAFATTPEEIRQANFILAKTKSYLTDTLKVGEHMTTEHLETMLKAIWNREGLFGALKHLTDAQMFHLSTAAKLSFHHQAGLTAEGLQKAVIQAGNLSRLDEQLASQLGHVAQLGGDKVMASILRRSLNVANLTGGIARETSHMAEAVTRCAERAVIEGTPIETFVKEHLHNVVSDYADYVKASGNKSRCAALAGQIDKLKATLRDEGKLSQPMLEELAELLERNGRSGPKVLRWLKGSGLKNLADEVRMITPLVDGQSSATQIMQNRIEAIMTQLVKSTASHPGQLTLLKENQVMVRNLLKGEGRLSLALTKSMAKTPAEFATMLHTELEGILKGGLRQTGQLYNMAMRVLKRMPTEAEVYFNPKEIEGVKTSVDPYLKMIEKKLLEVGKTKAVGSRQFMQDVLQPLAKSNAIWRYGVWSVAIATSMVGIGYLIPKVQYWITKMLTGSDIHPGLVAIEKKLGVTNQRNA